MFDQSIEREHFILEAEIIVSQKKKKNSYSIKKQNKTKQKKNCVTLLFQSLHSIENLHCLITGNVFDIFINEEKVYI